MNYTVTTGDMSFEWDVDKASLNESKHGVSFIQPARTDLFCLALALKLDSSWCAIATEAVVMLFGSSLRALQRGVNRKTI
jgi:hypothetical protein